MESYIILDADILHAGFQNLVTMGDSQLRTAMAIEQY